MAYVISIRLELSADSICTGFVGGQNKVSDPLSFKALVQEAIDVKVRLMDSKEHDTWRWHKLCQGVVELPECDITIRSEESWSVFAIYKQTRKLFMSTARFNDIHLQFTIFLAESLAENRRERGL